MLRSFTGQTTRPPFPHLVLFGVWVVLPLQLYLHNFFIEPPPCDVKEKLVREKEEEKKGRRSWYLIDGIEYWLAYTRPKKRWWWYDEDIATTTKRVAISSYRHIFLDKKKGNKRKKINYFFLCLVEKAEGLGRAFQHKTQSAHNYRYSICWCMIGKGQIDDGEKGRERDGEPIVPLYRRPTQHQTHAASM